MHLCHFVKHLPVYLCLVTYLLTYFAYLLTYLLTYTQQIKRRRRDFLYDLGVALVRPHLANRVANPVGLQLPLRSAIQTVTGEPVVDPGSHSVPTSSEEDQPPVKRFEVAVVSAVTPSQALESQRERKVRRPTSHSIGAVAVTTGPA